jgi:hypothetical protein
MEPGEALSAAAQIAVTLAGFAGVVVVFRRESVHEWSPVDKFRLRLLLTNSILSLTFCMIGLLLLTIKPTPLGIWRWCSGAALVIFLPFAIATTKGFRRFNPQQLKNAHATLFPFYLFVALGTGSTLLQFLQRRDSQCILALLHRNCHPASCRDVPVCAYHFGAAGIKRASSKSGEFLLASRRTSR